MNEITGYIHPQYAYSLEEFGQPQELPKCGGWVLVRQIPGFQDRDAMGCYPLFFCQNWSNLHDDLENIRNELVSLSLVTDPFCEYDLVNLQKCFNVVIPFKEHFVTDLSQPIGKIVSASHRSIVRKALRSVEVELCADPVMYIDEWIKLFANLVDRHGITGIRAFSPTAFVRQLKTPGMTMFRASSHDVTIGLDLWYVYGNVAYGHLVAMNQLGYKLSASYALKWFLIQYFADKVLWLDLGAGAGITGGKLDGLSYFKQGWATETRPVYFCGRIFNPERYQEITKEKDLTNSNYFPAYREGEFE